MKYSKKIIEALYSLLRNEKVYCRRLGPLDEILYSRGHFDISYDHQRRYYTLKDPEAFRIDLSTIDERFKDIERLQQLSDSNPSRGDMAKYNGNSKINRKRTFNGFMINSYQPIPATLLNHQYIVNPTEGTFTFVYDWQNFCIPEDVVVIGIENCENYEKIRLQKETFEDAVEKLTGRPDTPILFVSRYPLENSSTDLRHWLMSIPNKYIHYGDFDLKGIEIFHNEYYKYLVGRSSFLIPEDIETLIMNGSRERWDKQYESRKVTSPIPKVQSLIDMLYKYKRCYDQEGLEKT